MTIAWSCVARDGIVLAEAGSDNGKGSVIRTAKRIMSMEPTCGWEMCASLHNAPYRGIKFHVYEACGDNDKMLIWSFCCVYNSKSTKKICAKAFLSKLVYTTETLRCKPSWREGVVLSAQPEFAPTLRGLMDSAERDYKVYLLNKRVEETKKVMQRNIEAVLEKGVKVDDLQTEAEELNQMSRVFKKKSRQFKRLKMMQNAKYGVKLGTAVTATAGILIVPLIMV
jgi:hypothetical protein